VRGVTGEEKRKWEKGVQFTLNYIYDELEKF
jgi:hypothetical protein